MTTGDRSVNGARKNSPIEPSCILPDAINQTLIDEDNDNQSTVSDDLTTVTPLSDFWSDADINSDESDYGDDLEALSRALKEATAEVEDAMAVINDYENRVRDRQSRNGDTDGDLDPRLKKKQTDEISPIPIEACNRSIGNDNDNNHTSDDSAPMFTFVPATGDVITSASENGSYSGPSFTETTNRGHAPSHDDNLSDVTLTTRGLKKSLTMSPKSPKTLSTNDKAYLVQPEPDSMTVDKTDDTSSYMSNEVGDTQNRNHGHQQVGVTLTSKPPRPPRRSSVPTAKGRESRRLTGSSSRGFRIPCRMDPTNPERFPGRRCHPGSNQDGDRRKVPFAPNDDLGPLFARAIVASGDGPKYLSSSERPGETTLDVKDDNRANGADNATYTVTSSSGVSNQVSSDIKLVRKLL